MRHMPSRTQNWGERVGAALAPYGGRGIPPPCREGVRSGFVSGSPIGGLVSVYIRAHVGAYKTAYTRCTSKELTNFGGLA